MLHVYFKKWPCRYIRFKGGDPLPSPPEGVTQSVSVGEGRKAWRTSILRTFRYLCVFIAFQLEAMPYLEHLVCCFASRACLNWL